MLEKWSNSHKQEFLSHIRDSFIQRKKSGKIIEKEEWKSLFPMNSYEHRYLIDLVDCDVFFEEVEHSLKNSSYREIGEYSLPDHYDHALIGLYLPILLRRFREFEIQDQAHNFRDIPF